MHQAKRIKYQNKIPHDLVRSVQEQYIQKVVDTIRVYIIDSEYIIKI